MSESTRPRVCQGKEASACEAARLAQHEGLVQWVVRRQWLGPLAFADALHEGRIGLWQALRHYDPARGTTFSTYAVPAITHAVWEAVARERAALPRVPTPSAALDPAAALHVAEVAAAVRAAVRQLPPPLADVVLAHAGLDGHEPETFVAIGARLGRTKQRAHQLYADALARLMHPAHSRTLRQLTDRLTRADYRATLARQQRRARRRRGGR